VNPGQDTSRHCES